MRCLRRALCLGPLSLLAACARCEAPPPRPREPTLKVAPDPAAPANGRRVVAAGQIAQSWHVGAWAPSSITLTEVAPGDAIVVLGAYWGDLEARSSTEPTDDQGVLRQPQNDLTDCTRRQMRFAPGSPTSATDTLSSASHSKERPS